jgi:hypothetical protein
VSTLTSTRLETVTAASLPTATTLPHRCLPCWSWRPAGSQLDVDPISNGSSGVRHRVGSVSGSCPVPVRFLTGPRVWENFLYEVQDGPTSGPYAPRPGRGHRPLRWRSATASSLRGPSLARVPELERRSSLIQNEPPAGSLAPVRAGPSTADQASRADQPAPPQTLVAPAQARGVLRRHRPARSPGGWSTADGPKASRWGRRGLSALLLNHDAIDSIATCSVAIYRA